MVSELSVLNIDKALGFILFILESRLTVVSFVKLENFSMKSSVKTSSAQYIFKVSMFELLNAS